MLRRRAFTVCPHRAVPSFLPPIPFLNAAPFAYLDTLLATKAHEAALRADTKKDKILPFAFLRVPSCVFVAKRFLKQEEFGAVGVLDEECQAMCRTRNRAAFHSLQAMLSSARRSSIVVLHSAARASRLAWNAARA